jgi:hypothetical protein
VNCLEDVVMLEDELDIVLVRKLLEFALHRR